MESDSLEHHGQMALLPSPNVLLTQEKPFFIGSKLTRQEHTFTMGTMECKGQQDSMVH
uniref:Uncharacterized protein n=1 Tax=Rhizophora mucronata TaxID=61149 RepID=A0A2P2NFZ7_RHIMU